MPRQVEGGPPEQRGPFPAPEFPRASRPLLEEPERAREPPEAPRTPALAGTPEAPTVSRQRREGVRVPGREAIAPRPAQGAPVPGEEEGGRRQEDPQGPQPGCFAAAA